MIELLIPTPDQATQTARSFIEIMGKRRIAAFAGEMGAGKTTFIKAICRELGVTDEVSSPTFALVYEYKSAEGPVFHFDFYRINDPAELFDLGYEDYFFSGSFCFIEWPEKALHLIPEDALLCKIEVRENGLRSLIIEA